VEIVVQVAGQEEKLLNLWDYQLNTQAGMEENTRLLILMEEEVGLLDLMETESLGKKVQILTILVEMAGLGIMDQEELVELGVTILTEGMA
jgi:hypothetical protein